MTTSTTPKPLRSANGVNLWHWSQLKKGNVFMQSLDPKMLQGEGLPVWKKVKIKDASSFAIFENAYVLYDRSYVIAKIQQTLTENFKDLSLDDLTTFLAEAYEQTQKGIQPRKPEIPALPPLEAQDETI